MKNYKYIFVSKSILKKLLSILVSKNNFKNPLRGTESGIILIYNSKK